MQKCHMPMSLAPGPLMRSWNARLVLVMAVAVAPAYAQPTVDPAPAAPGHALRRSRRPTPTRALARPTSITTAPPIPGIPAPDISRGFSGIPRSAQPPLTASQQRILECTYRLRGSERRHALHAVRAVDLHPRKPAPLVVDLHGLNITPLQQILFDGTTDFAERYGFIVLAPMGFNVSSWWGSRTGTPVATAAVKPGTDMRYSTTELSEIDTMALLKSIRQQYTIDSDRIYLDGSFDGWCGHLLSRWQVQRHLGGPRANLRRRRNR